MHPNPLLRLFFKHKGAEQSARTRKSQLKKQFENGEIDKQFYLNKCRELDVSIRDNCAKAKKIKDDHT